MTRERTTSRAPWMGVAGIVLLTVWFVGSLAFLRGTETHSDALPRGIDKVVIFGVPGLTIDDVNRTTMPELTALAARGATAASNIRGGGTSPLIPEAYATIGAGYRVTTGMRGGRAIDTETGAAAAVRIVDMPGPTTERGRDDEGRPGALGLALAQAGKRTAVVTNADRMIDGVRHPAAPAALAAADPDGNVDDGTVGPHLTRLDRLAPGGLVISRAAFLDATRSALANADLVVVDPGVTTRLVRSGEGKGKGGRIAWRSALRQTDDVIGDVERSLGPRTALFVVGVTPPASTWQLTPVVAVGGGIGPGHLKSPSTHRDDLVTITDLAPTTLSLLGDTVPETMTGHVLRVVPGSTGLASMDAFNDMLVSRRSTDQPLTLVFILLQSALYALGVLALVRTKLTGRSGDALLVAVLTCAAWPLATFWVRASLTVSAQGVTTGLVTWGLAFVVAMVAMRFRTHPLDPLLVVCGATVATIVLDLSTGAHLQYGSFFGYAPNKGTRFTGLGNAAFALLASSTVVVCTALVARSRRPARGWWAAVFVALAVLAADGAPWMGADVGGILALVPVLVLLHWAMRGRTVNVRTLIVAGLAALCVLAVAVGLDSLRAPEQRTHLSRFFLGIGDWQMVRSTIAVKWSANMRLLRESMWAWLVPITVALSLVALTVGRLWQRALPPGSPERYGVTATLALALIAWLLNDSGIVIVALASVYIGPYVLLVAQDRERDLESDVVADESGSAVVDA